jgi:hypothetical protein
MDMLDKAELERRKLWDALVNLSSDYGELVDEPMDMTALRMWVEAAFAVCDDYIVDKANAVLEPWGLRMVRLPRAVTNLQIRPPGVAFPNSCSC